MQLENLYPVDFKKINLLDRKVKIENTKTLLLGVKGSGKSSVLINYLKELKKELFLYINFNDERVNKKELEKNLNEFIIKNKIEVLAIDNFDFSIKLPQLKSTVLTSNQFKSLDGFEIKELFPLDFEEYILFDKRHQEAIHSFNSFLKDGTFPKIYFTQHYEKVREAQKNIKNFTDNETELLILKQLILSSGFIISPFQIFTTLKKKIKLSKDKLYYIIDKFKKNKIIFFVDKFNHPKANKKLYLIDFSLKNALTFNKNFLKEFENMVFLELLKRDKLIYFSDEIEFYLPNENLAILTIPFLTLNSIKEKIKKIENKLLILKIKKLKIITVSFELNLKENNTFIEAIPFWIWATQD